MEPRCDPFAVLIYWCAEGPTGQAPLVAEDHFKAVLKRLIDTPKAALAEAEQRRVKRERRKKPAA